MAEIEFLDDQQPVVAELVIDDDSAAPHGQPCEACGCPIEDDDHFCPACGQPHQVKSEQTSEQQQTAQKCFRCDNCGSEVVTDSEQRSYVCAFCDSTYVVEFSPSETDRQEPEFVIGFNLTLDQAKEKFDKWIRENSWIRPGDMRTAMVAEKMKGVYLPFWSFSMLAQSNWSATVGEYWYRTERYTTMEKGKLVTKTRRVRETEWWPLSGRHHRYHHSFLVSGSRGLEQKYAELIKPFNLPALKRYRAYFLAGWLCEEYSIERSAALTICKQEFNRRQQQAVSAFLPGDTARNQTVDTRFSHIQSDLCLLPVYILSYRYKDKLFRFLINGQTGKSWGKKPIAWKRILAVVFGGIALLIVVALIVALVAQNV